MLEGGLTTVRQREGERDIRDMVRGRKEISYWDDAVKLCVSE